MYDLVAAAVAIQPSVITKSMITHCDVERRNRVELVS